MYINIATAETSITWVRIKWSKLHSLRVRIIVINDSVFCAVSEQLLVCTNRSIAIKVMPIGLQFSSYRRLEM